MDKEETINNAAAQQETPPVTQPAASPKWRQLLAQRNPDLNLDDDDATSQYLSDSFSDYDKLKNDRQKFNDMISSDDRAAGLLSGMATGVDENGEPFSFDEYMANNYLEDWAAGLSPEEIAKKAKQREADRIKKEAEVGKRAKELESNSQTSDAALTEAMAEANIDEQTASDMIAWLYGNETTPGAADRAASYSLTKEDWLRLIYAFNRDADRNAARQEGARSSRSRRPSHRDLSDVPTDTGAGGGMESNRTTGNPTLDTYDKMKRKY